MAEDVGIRVSTETLRRTLAKEYILFSCPQHTISSSNPDYHVKKTIEETRDQLKPTDVFYHEDEFNIIWLAILRAM